MTEGISEKFSKKKRGRPRIMHDRMYQFLKSTSPEDSERTIQSYYHFITALSWLQDEDKNPLPGLEWLFQERPVKGAGVLKQTILSELGRFPDPASAYEAALSLCEWKPSTSVALPWLRRRRQSLKGKHTVAVGKAKDLEEVLLTALNRFIARYPDTSKEVIEEALRLVWSDVVTYHETEESHD